MDTYFKDKQLSDLVVEKPEAVADEKTFTSKMKDECLKYVKFQGGCIGSTEENKEYIGKGDGQICEKLGIKPVQLQEFKASLQSRIAELTAPEPVEEIGKELPKPVIKEEVIEGLK